MEKLEQLYEGKAKKVYRTNDPSTFWVYYKDSATAFNAQKKGEIEGKGVLNNLISAHFFAVLAEQGIENHFIKVISPCEMLVKKLEIVKVEVIIRNIVAGSMSKRLGVAEGTVLPTPVLEYSYKDDELGDPLINDYHIQALGLATPAEMRTIADMSFRINDILSKYMRGLNVLLVDFKLEFGRCNGRIILGDEISPDTCRFWDATTMEKLDKDRFRRDLGGVAEAYREIFNRLTGGETHVES
ncbi:MAG: phosphoribosylaminoimidazole-succinocarboxamide synthase [Bacillota bacterium]|nr:MAG: phosphoribosylaminoimidazole-succinocarboxamide synthase [Bacillota bacterium]MBS3949802.1 phosphoribosylaminoimidazolesuccinocarboxamide synthase [Peptococcaceae bacterium]